MKRKRGNKKGKSKGIAEVAANESISNKGSQIEVEENENNSVMEVEVESTPSSTATDHNVANINADGLIDKAIGKSVHSVKVKLKTSKTLDPQTATSETPMQCDMGSERKNLTAEKMEDSANSVPEIKMLVSRPTSKKSSSIKIKSSRTMKDGENQAKKDGMPLGESCKFRHDSRYSKQELNSALVVIKKVMKMDAAEPFNAPVNPVALGIPDYFDVIDTPMDFGTICSSLESGKKYMNSEDVFKDVQYIWGNCYKYNNKGDYILDLMRRVKKNFSKYWTAAGLYTGPPKSTYENAGPSSPGKVLAKGGQSKHKSWKRNGRRHKHDCLCAVCILKRRRREREANARIAKGLSGAGNNDAQEFKKEGSSPIESPCGEDSSSNPEDMIDQEVDDDGVEEIGVKSKRDVSNSQYITPAKQEEAEEEEQEEEEEEEEEGDDAEDEEDEEKETAEKKDERAKAAEESEKKLILQNTGQSLDDGQTYAISPHLPESVSVDLRKHKDLETVYKKAKILNDFRDENPMVVDLCRILFPDNPKSVWTGPHSLGQAKLDKQHNPPTSSIRAAINTFFKC